MSKKRNSKNKVTPAATGETNENKVNFDSWFALRAIKIPSQHRKEIIKADFIARKVPMMASLAEFDMALTKYGLKLD